MQDHNWSPDIRYDCIWLQWFLMYLKDVDLIAALKECASHLTINPKDGSSGLIFIKDNVGSTRSFEDKKDNSITRSPERFNEICEYAGLEIVEKSYQPKWP